MGIEIKNLKYIYANKTTFAYNALKGINLTINDGTFNAIIGHTGSGKSTLIQHLNGLVVPTHGEVKVGNITINNKGKIKNWKQLRKNVGLVFQFPEYQLFEETVEKDIMFGPLNFGMKLEEAKDAAKKALKLVHLDESFLTRSPFELSGGQKRRVAIAGILAINPAVLILDEPTAGLDPNGAKEMMELFYSLHKNNNKTIILVTHDMNHVLDYCQNVIVLKGGEVVAVDSPLSIFKNDELMRSIAIAPPIIIDFARKLIKKGFSIDLKKIHSLESLALEIKQVIK